ncbi:MAG: hypothetical protein KKD69_06895 [Euryarchaeota archaeon]|nr:hypothetical protein [Euryarchaeota archaeon]
MFGETHTRMNTKNINFSDSKMGICFYTFLYLKKVAKELLTTLKQEKLVLDWRKRQQSRVYQHIYDSYFGQGQSIYPPAI